MVMEQGASIELAPCFVINSLEHQKQLDNSNLSCIISINNV